MSQEAQAWPKSSYKVQLDVGANEGNTVAARLLKCTSGDYVHMNTSIH